MKTVKSRKVFRHDKQPVYQALARINQAFEVIETELAHLQNESIMPGEPLNIFRSKELRAGINHSIVDLLKDREARDWAIWGRHRLTRERKLNPELRRKSKS